MNAIRMLEKALWHMAGGRGRLERRTTLPEGYKIDQLAKGKGLCRQRRNPHAGSRHLSRAVHAKFIENARARLEIGRQPLHQARDVEEDVAPAIVGTKE